MAQAIQTGKEAPDFELVDVRGDVVRLSQFRNKSIVVLVFNRGFI